MRPPLPWRGLREHLLLTLRLNFRSRAPLVYGYVVPVFFLLAFGSVFRSTAPPLLHEMGQLLTITVLGGACFGMPTAMVAERERGVWRRYRLLPAAAGGILLSTAVARTVLVCSAALLQIVLAWAIYRTPWPAQPWALAVAFMCVCFAFLGLGLVIAMLADNVPSVQAIGQAVFLPMIMVGGVGVPLRTLPPWAQHVAGFLPGRYAVEVLQSCIEPGSGGLAGKGFPLMALGVIGVAAWLAGAGLFRWEPGPRAVGRRGKAWITVALAAWVLVGLAAEYALPAHRPSTAVPRPVSAPPAEPASWRQLTDADLNRISFDGLLPDDGYISPLAADYSGLDEAGKARLDHIQDDLAYWPPGTVDDPAQRVRNLLSVCTVADLAQDENEAEIARAVFDQIREAVPADTLRKVLAWIILHPEGGQVVTDASEFGIARGPTEDRVRERSAIYARKLLRSMRGSGGAR